MIGRNYFLLLFSITLITSASVPQLDLTFSMDSLRANICLGSSSQCFSPEISLNTYYTWIIDVDNQLSTSPNKFDKKRSNTCELVEDKKQFLLEGKNEIMGITYRDTLKLSNQSLDKFRFVSTTDTSMFKGYEGVLGLGFMPNQKQDDYSFISQLMNNRLISHRIFTIGFAGKNKGVMTFGQIPTDILKDYKNFGTCNTLSFTKESTETNWECQMQSISIGQDYNKDNLIDTKGATVKFSYNTEKTLVPINILLQFEAKYFAIAIEDGDCNFGIDNGHYLYSCLTNQIKGFEEISLVFGDWGIHVNYEDLFIKNEESNEYEFFLYNLDGYDGFVIGAGLMKKYRMIFDEENMKIGFYNGQNQYLIYKGIAPLIPPKVPDDQRPEPGKPLQPGEKEPLRPPTDKDKPLPLPKQKGSFFQRFFMTVGILSLLIGAMFLVWLGFRYMRRKKYADPSFYYKATDDLFEEGTRIE